MSEEYQTNDSSLNPGWPKKPPVNKWRALARQVAISALVGYFLIAAYGKWHYLRSWHVEPVSEENVLIGENAAATSVSGTYSVYSGSTTAESRGQSTPLIRANAFGLAAYSINQSGIWAEVELWQVNRQ